MVLASLTTVMAPVLVPEVATAMDMAPPPAGVQAMDMAPVLVPEVATAMDMINLHELLRSELLRRVLRLCLM